MFMLSSSSSRPNHIVPVSPSLRKEMHRKLKTERDDYVKGHARSIAAKKFGMAACYQQMALSIEDQMKGLLVDPSPLSPSFIKLELLKFKNDGNGSDNESSTKSYASDVAISPPRKPRKIPEFIGTPSGYMGECDSSPARKPTLGAKSTPRRQRQRTRLLSTIGRTPFNTPLGLAAPSGGPKGIAVPRTPFNSPSDSTAPTGAVTGSNGLFSQESRDIVATPRTDDAPPHEERDSISTSRRRGGARIMSALSKAAARLSPARRTHAYKPLKSPNSDYDADEESSAESSVDSTLALHNGYPHFIWEGGPGSRTYSG